MIEQPPKTKFTAKSLELLNDKDISKMVKSLNDEYLYWDKIKYKSKDIEPQQLWEIVKISRQLTYSQLKFGTYLFNYASTEYIQKVVHYFDMHIGGYMGAKSVIPEEDKMRYLVSSIMEEAISSSQIEGANTTRKKAKEMLRKEVKPKTKSEQMILNNYLTIKHITQNRNESLTPERLLHIHRLISCDTLDSKIEEGNFRNSDDIFVVNHINSEVVHTPPPYIEINDLIGDLCNFFNSEDEKFVHPVLKAIIVHFMIGWIHPFTDGNGRTARILFYWYLLKKGYWLTEYLSISRIIQDTKNQYERAFIYTETDSNDLTYFVTYNLKVMEKAFDALKKYIQQKQKENLQAESFVRIPNVNNRQAQLLKLLYNEPKIIFNVKEVENRFVVSNYTARADLKGLVDLGFLEAIQVNKVKQNFIRSSQFSTILHKYNIK